jgi:hypothetical protein
MPNTGLFSRHLRDKKEAKGLTPGQQADLDTFEHKSAHAETKLRGTRWKFDKLLPHYYRLADFVIKDAQPISVVTSKQFQK